MAASEGTVTPTRTGEARLNLATRLPGNLSLRLQRYFLKVSQSLRLVTGRIAFQAESCPEGPELPTDPRALTCSARTWGRGISAGGPQFQVPRCRSQPGHSRTSPLETVTDPTVIEPRTAARPRQKLTTQGLTRGLSPRPLSSVSDDCPSSWVPGVFGWTRVLDVLSPVFN